MPKPRYAQVSLEATPYYHCVSRCVRRAFLCGTNQISGNSYEHRRQWIEDKLLELAGIFALDICVYAIMSNHYHVVFCVDQDKAESWSQTEVIHQWHQLFSGTVFFQRFLQGEKRGTAELKRLDNSVREWHSRLAGLCVFWMNQPLLPVWPMLTSTLFVPVWQKPPRLSDHASIQKRLGKPQNAAQPNHPQQQDNQLLVFAGDLKESMPRGLSFRLTDYPLVRLVR